MPFTYTLVFTGTATSGTISITGEISRCSSNGPPTISSFSPASGTAGNLVTINGSNFSPILANNVVTFKGVSAVVTGAQPGHLFALVPAGATTGTISVTTSAGTVTSSSSFTVTVGTPAATMAWGGVHHRLDSNGTVFDALDVGINSYASTLAGMTLTVAGPSGFSYTFTDVDISRYINGQLAVYKKYVSPTTLAPGVYTFTLNDGQGHTSHRVDTHVTVASMLQVDSATIQLQRKSDGSYRISFAPLNAAFTYDYRVRINRNDAANTSVYDSTRAMTSFVDVPAGILYDDSMYKVRIEAVDSANGDLSTNRSLSAWKLFSPKTGDYNANRLLTNSAGINNRTDFSATPTLTFDAALNVSALGSVTSLSLTGPAGFTKYDFNLTTDISNSTSDGTAQTTIFYKKFPTGTTMPTGLYTFTYVANSLTHTAYATLTSPVSYTPVDSTTMQAQELSKGNIRFSWANADHTGALYYRVMLLGAAATSTTYVTARQNQAFVDIPKSIVTGTTYPFVNWRVEAYDSSDFTTQRNRFHSASKPIPSTTYDATVPVINSYKVRNMNKPDGTSATQLFIAASDLDGTITERRVDGPNGYIRTLTSPDVYTQGAYSLSESGSPATGLYTITAVDNSSKRAVQFKYQPTPKVIPVVDYHTFQVDLEPNGDPRISWAPVVSDVPLWYYLEAYDADTLYPVVIPSTYPAGSMTQQTSVTVPAALMPAQMMFRIVVFDGSNSTTYNNASRSIMVKYQPGLNYAGLVDADNDGYASNIDAIDNNQNVDPFHPTAGGTYTYNAANSLLSLNWTSSNFVCGGPTLGSESQTVTSLTATTLSWKNGSDTMSWSRASGTAGNILGTWSSTDIYSGNVYTITFNANGTIAVSASIITCGGANIPPIAVPQATIQVDGTILDWAAITPMITDPAGDADYTGLDITGVSMAQDSQNIYFRADRVGNNLPSNEYSNFWFYLRPWSPGKKGYAVELFHSSPTQHEARLWDISANPDDYTTYVSLSSSVTNVFTNTTIEFSIPKNLITVENEFTLSFYTHHSLGYVWQSASDVPAYDVKVTQITAAPSAPAPTITSFTPVSGAVGSQVTITGTNFDLTPGNNTVKFNGIPATVTSGGASSLTVTVPPGASTGPISVTRAGMTATGGTFTYYVPLTLTFAGTGGGSVHSTPAGIACSGNSCPSANYSSGTVVTLSATATAGSLFTGWPVPLCTLDMNGNCAVTMSELKNITATFNVMQLSRIADTYYGLLAHAYTAAVNNNTIQARDTTFIENLILNKAISLSFNGGYNTGFISNSGGFTYLDGQLTISAGTLIVQGLKIK